MGKDKLFLIIILFGFSGTYAYNFMESQPIWEANFIEAVYDVESSKNYTVIGAGKTIYLMDRKGNTIWSYKTGGNLDAVGLSKRGDYVLAASRDMQIYIIDINSSLIKVLPYDGWVVDFDTSEPNENITNPLFPYPEKGYFVGVRRRELVWKQPYFTYGINWLTKEPRIIGVGSTFINYTPICATSEIFLNRTSNWGLPISTYAGDAVGKLGLGRENSHCSWGNYTVVSTTNEKLHLVTLFDFSQKENSVVWQLRPSSEVGLVRLAENGSYVVVASNTTVALHRNPSAKKPIIVLANSIDNSMASDFFAFLQNNSFNVTLVTTSNFEQYKKERFIIILGGPDAYEGVGDVVKHVLNVKEGDVLRSRGNRKMFVKSDVWAQGQVVMVLAGSGRDETRRAHRENKEDVFNIAG